MLGERRLRSSSRSTSRQSNTDASASGHPSPFAPVDINIKVAATSTQIPSLHTPSSSSQNAVTNMSEKIMTRSATRRSHATETDVVEKAQPLRQSRGKGRMQTDDKAIALEEGPHDQVNIILTRSRSRTSFRSRRSSVTPFSDRPSQASKERSVLKDRSRNSSVVSKQSRSRTASLTPRQSPVTFKRKHALQEEDFLSLNFATPGKKSQPQSREATPSSRATRRRRKYTHEALDGELLVSQDLEYNTDRRESPNRAAGHKSAINNSFSAEATRHIISDVDMSELNTQTNSSTVPVKPVAVKGVPSFLESEDEFADNGNNAAFNRARVQTGGAFSLFGNNGGSVFKMATPVSSKSFTAFRADGISPSDDEDEFWKSPPAKMQIGRSILPPSGSTSGSTSRSSSKRTSPVPYSAQKLPDQGLHPLTFYPGPHHLSEALHQPLSTAGGWQSPSHHEIRQHAETSLVLSSGPSNTKDCYLAVQIV
ncbi:hypothetical protein BC829DRAFT_83631 [Chytridium lagenaria]|nr:hypothetical protein BC829DRAFT_83631 [Chytridium lagenaria]